MAERCIIGNCHDFSIFYFYIVVISIYHSLTPKPFLQQLFNPLLAEFWQNANDDQF